MNGQANVIERTLPLIYFFFSLFRVADEKGGARVDESNIVDSSNLGISR